MPDVLVAERGILFSASMVRAIIEGRKTVTRRIMKPQPEPRWNLRESEAGSASFCRGEHHRSSDCSDDVVIRCPQGKPVDRLYVKETWRAGPQWDAWAPRDIGEAAAIWYEADHPTPPQGAGRIRQSIFMRPWMSRLWLEVVSVRPERLHDMTEQEVQAEGLDVSGFEAFEAFAHLWDQINGERARWASDPWVWRIEFRRVAGGGGCT